MKKLMAFVLCLLLLPILTVQADSPLILDHADVIDAPTESALNQTLTELKAAFDMDIVILTTDTLMGGAAPEAYADDYFEMNYGNNGVLFLLDMGSRSWHISTDGKAIDLLSNHDLEQIELAVVPYLSDGLYGRGFEVYLEMLPELLTSNGTNTEEDADFLGYLMISAVPGAILAAIILAVMKSAMNSQKPRHSAADYTDHGSFRLRSHSDLFLYSNVTKRAKPKNNSGSSGSTTHRSSSGRSHGGRGGKF